VDEQLAAADPDLVLVDAMVYKHSKQSEGHRVLVSQKQIGGLTALLVGFQELNRLWHRWVGDGCLNALPVLCVLPPASRAWPIEHLFSGHLSRI